MAKYGQTTQAKRAAVILLHTKLDHKALDPAHALAESYAHANGKQASLLQPCMVSIVTHSMAAGGHASGVRLSVQHTWQSELVDGSAGNFRGRFRILSNVVSRLLPLHSTICMLSTHTPTPRTLWWLGRRAPKAGVVLVANQALCPSKV